MATEALQFFTPAVGRLISGSLTEKRKKDNDNREIPLDEQRFEYGVAFNKQEIWSLLVEQFYPYLASALAADQNGLNRMTNWFSTLDGFSMKITDGDKPRARDGKVNEHAAGCFVFWFTSIEVRTVGPSNEELVADAIKRGFYVQVAGNIRPNGQPGDRAGIYMNGSIVRLIAEGEVIAGGIDADTAFGGTAAPTALPPGAMPVGTSNGAAGAFGGAPGLPGAVPGGAPAPAQTGHAQPPAMPGAAPQTASPGNPPAMPGAAPVQQQQYGAPQMPGAPQQGVPGQQPGAAPQTTPHTGILAGPPPMPGQ